MGMIIRTRRGVTNIGEIQCVYDQLAEIAREVGSARPP
jgi:hypothetical protein